MKYKIPLIVGISTTSALMLGFNAISDSNQNKAIETAERLELCADNIGQLECHDLISNRVNPSSIDGTDNGYIYTFSRQEILNEAGDKRKFVDSNRQEIAVFGGSVLMGLLFTTPFIAAGYLGDREKQEKQKTKNIKK